MNNEIFDVFDEAMNKIGTAGRSDVHREGLWHQTFHCWIWKREASGIRLIFQLRHEDKDSFPGLLDISCAGHLLAGEAAQDGVRELYEELGVRAEFSELVPCGIYTEEDVISETFIDREFCHVFLLENNDPLDAYRMQPDEVSGLFLVSLEDLKRLLEEEAEITGEGLVTGPGGDVIPQTRRIRKEYLVPHPGDYFQLLFKALEAMLSGER